MRGLKRVERYRINHDYSVAPLAGAWIETYLWGHAAPTDIVAPLAGAWIETLVRLRWDSPALVTPLAGAWIETF